MHNIELNHLKNLIVSKIQEKGFISFEEYMKLALYAPGLGYYSGGAVKFGKEGDFITAPEISSLFSECLARNFLGVVKEIKNANILEFGAGTGKMAADILMTLEKYQSLPEKYFILEVSAELRARQRDTLNRLCPKIASRVLWLDRLPPAGFKGLVLANEVLDAMPVRRFCISEQQMYEYYVAEKEGQLYFKKLLIDNININLNSDANANMDMDMKWNAALEYIKEKYITESTLNSKNPIYLNPNLSHHLSRHLHHDLNHCTQDYTFEINFNITPWINSISSFLEQGAVLIIDYGFPRQELYHPDRSMGTLMCHHRHKAHHDPFLYPGLQDITTHVDFTLIAEAAQDNGLDVLGFLPQAGFLLNSGLLEMLQKKIEETKGSANNAMAVDHMKRSHAIQLLTSPAEMGEFFKVIGLGKQCDATLLPGFCMNDQRHRL